MSAPRAPGHNRSRSVTITRYNGVTSTHIAAVDILTKSHAVTVGYASKKRNNELLPELPYSMTSTVWEQSVVGRSNSLANFDKGAITDAWSFLNVPDPVFEDPRGAAAASAMQKFFENADSHKSNVGVTIAELPKTIELIGSTATRIYDLFRSLKRFDIPGAFAAIGLDSKKHQKSLARRSRSVPRTPKGRMDFASSAILEVQYGWRPLLSEIDNAMSDLAEKFAKQGEHIYIRGGATREGSVSNWSGPFTTTSRKQFAGKPVNRVQAGVIAYAQIVDANARTRSGMGVVNPLEIAWELLPFSFVADWFAPIGSWLSSLDALSGLSFVKGSRSALWTVQWSGHMSGYITTGTPIRFKGEQKTYKKVVFTRTVLTSFPSTFSMFHIKGLRQALGTEHSINAIALLHQVMKGKNADRF